MSAPSDYVSVFLQHPFPWSLLLLLLLALMRLLPVLLLAPFYGAQVLPNTIKVGLGLAIAMVFMPELIYLTDQPLNFDLVFIALCIKELFIGFLLGFLVTIPFAIAGMAGVWIDHQRGSSSFMFVDPTLRAPISPQGRLFTNMMIYTFFLIGGQFYFMESIALSYQMSPPTKFLSASFFTAGNAFFWQTIIKALNNIVRISVQLAAPALVTMFMSDIFLGVANRLAPQVPMAFLGWALKSLFAIAIVWLGWLFIVQRFNIIDFEWLKIIDQLVRTFKPV